MTTRTLSPLVWREYRVAVLIAPRRCRRLDGICSDNPIAIATITLRAGQRAPRVEPEREPASDVKGAQFGMLGTLLFPVAVALFGIVALSVFGQLVVILLEGPR